MRNPVMRALREAVRAEISHAFEVTGHARPRDVARVVCALHPDDVLSIGTRLAEDALTGDRPSRAQEEYPGSGSGQPDAIAWGARDIDRATAAGHQHSARRGRGRRRRRRHLQAVWPRPRWPTSMPGLQLLATQINADTRRHRALKELRDLALAAGATDDSPLLSAFSTAESSMTEVV